MQFSDSILSLTLWQSKLEPPMRQALLRAFEFASPHWREVDNLDLPAVVPPTTDPLIRAARRFCRPQNLGELSAMHRVAVLQAAEHRFGMLRLLVHEIVALGDEGVPLTLPGLANFEQEPPFRGFFELLPTVVLLRHRPLLFDIKARAYSEGVRSLLRRRRHIESRLLPIARSLAIQGTGDTELDCHIDETWALLRENEDEMEMAIRLRTEAIEKLFDYPVVDRVAEAMVEHAEMLLRYGDSKSQIEWLLESAAEKLALLAPEINLPLRRRLAQLQGAHAHEESATRH